MGFQKRRALWILSAASAFLALAVAALAQVGDAELSGIVTDPSGAPVAGAKLSLTNEDSGVNRAVIADTEGRYRFPALAPGRYVLKTEAVGFRTASLTGILLNVGMQLNTNVSLTVGNVQEQITVTADVPPIDITTAQVSGVV